MEKLTKRRNARSKGNVQLNSKRSNKEQEVVYILTDVKETVITENFYQPILLGVQNSICPKECSKKESQPTTTVSWLSLLIDNFTISLRMFRLHQRYSHNY